MRRILVVDDSAPDFSVEIQSDVLDESGAPPHLEHINPSDFFANGRSAEETVSRMLERIGVVSGDFWDVVAIDLYLGDFGLSAKENLEIPLRIAESFRVKNQSATMLLYSGTLSKYLEELFGTGASDTQLRRIFHASIANFIPRTRVAREVASATENPSWLLRVDRFLMKHSTIQVGPEEAEFQGRSFDDLAMAVRRQDQDGQKITQLAAEYGISCFADLNI